ncbi:MAG: exodeoxyribonuclease VII large subunit [Gammaproteobacteria bacterium]|nr:exodeoxyribonuclease VII large subunit [Gammaproteobacteria bacterium]
MSRDVYTVSRLNREVRASIEGNFGAQWVAGEISNLARPASGHLYFSLKDPSAQARCAMFRLRAGQLSFRPTDGMQVLAYARISFYEPRGEFQLVVEHLEPAGEGLLRLRFEALKQKLAAEGLFETARKRPLPAWPRAIGVVTSPTGAAVRDILQVLARRNPSIRVFVYPCAVQGVAAAGEIIAAIAAANRRAECEVLIVARGGGSLEDLWSFNEEAVVRAIGASRLPTICGIGHEIDFSLADFAADVRAPTPSAAAEISAPERRAVLQQFNGLQRRLRTTLAHCLTLSRQRLVGAQGRLVHPGRRIEQHQQRLDALVGRLTTTLGYRMVLLRQRLAGAQGRLVHPGRRIEQHHQRLDELLRRILPAQQRTWQLKHARLAAASAALAGASPAHRLALARAQEHGLWRRLGNVLPPLLQRLQARVTAAQRTLHAVSPAATLERGYAIVTQANGHIARDASQVAVGAAVHARLARGALVLRVERADPAIDPATDPAR